MKTNSIESEDIVSNGKVTTKCWLYKGHLNKYGYGTINFKGLQPQSHILSWECFNKKKRTAKKDGLKIMHLCDVRNCCNPKHLQLGTTSENKIASLSYSKNVTLNEEKVREIRVLLNEKKLTHKEIGKKYNVAENTIGSIKNNRSWTHVV